MIKIAIELNNVVRNINKQILKYYAKDIDRSLDLDEVDYTDDPFKYAKFDSKAARNEFVYIDYPYEIFGCAKPISTNLPTDINNWLAELTNYEEDDVQISFYSLEEEALTIQSTYFFLSKIGTRVREVIFPKSVEDIKDRYDVFVTANTSTIDGLGDDVYKIAIINEHNKDLAEKSNKSYPSLEELIKDESLLHEIHEYVSDEKKND